MTPDDGWDLVGLVDVVFDTKVVVFLTQTLIFNKKKCFKTSDEPCDPASMTFLFN